MSVRKELVWAVIGSRDYSSPLLVQKTVEYLNHWDRESILCSGDGGVVDTTAEDKAKELKMNRLIYPAKWTIYERKAGMLRNGQVVADSDLMLAFWDGVSPGTSNSVDRFKAKFGGERLLIIPEVTHLRPEEKKALWSNIRDIVLMYIKKYRGTKWNAHEITTLIIGNLVWLNFQTAWSPPWPVIEKVAALVPSMEFWYIDEGRYPNFWGKAIYTNGIQTSHAQNCDDDLAQLNLDLHGDDGSEEDEE